MINCNDPGGMLAGRYWRPMLEPAWLKWSQARNRWLSDGEKGW